MTIWIAQADVEHYAGIELRREDYDRLPIFDGRHLAPVWPAFEARLSDKPIGDFAYLTAGMLACRESVWDRVKSVIDGEVEALPIQSLPVPFVALNVTRLIDALDRQRSDIRYFPGSDRVYRVIGHVFHTEKLVSSALFKVAELRTDVFCTDGFRALVDQNELSGLEFRVVMKEERVEA